jgi:hypothetical protein
VSDLTLEDLIYHYGDAYRITYRLGQYRAERRDNHAVVRADTAEELLEHIRDDYHQKPVPRQ